MQTELDTVYISRRLCRECFLLLCILNCFQKKIIWKPYPAQQGGEGEMEQGVEGEEGGGASIARPSIEGR